MLSAHQIHAHQAQAEEYEAYDASPLLADLGAQFGHEHGGYNAHQGGGQGGQGQLGEVTNNVDEVVGIVGLIHEHTDLQDGKGNEQGQQLGVLKQGFQHVLDGYPGRTGGTLTNGKILALRQPGNVAQSPGHGKHEDQGDDKVVPAAKGKLCD